MKGRVLIDTSVWIDYLQNATSGLSEQIDEILSHCDVYVPKVVLAELIQGAYSEREINAINEFMEAFHITGENEDSWRKAGELSYNLKKKGKTVNLIDCYIAVIAIEQDCSIMTLDKHFKIMEKESGLKLISSQKVS